MGTLHYLPSSDCTTQRQNVHNKPVFYSSSRKSSTIFGLRFIIPLATIPVFITTLSIHSGNCLVFPALSSHSCPLSLLLAAVCCDQDLWKSLVHIILFHVVCRFVQRVKHKWQFKMCSQLHCILCHIHLTQNVSQRFPVCCLLHRLEIQLSTTHTTTQLLQ